MMRRLSRSFLFLVAVGAVAAATAAPAGPDASGAWRAAAFAAAIPRDDERGGAPPTTLTRHLNNNNNNVYALYNLDAFAVEFATADSADLQAAYSLALASGSSDTAPLTLVSETGKEASSLSYPLRATTQKFLYAGFQESIDAWVLREAGGSGGGGTGTGPTPAPTQYVPKGGEATGDGDDPPASTSSATGTAGTQDFPLNDIYIHLITVDLYVKLYVRNDVPGGGDGDGEDDGGSVRRRQLQRQLQAQNTSATAEQRPRYLLAELYPTIAFLEPTNTATKPTNGEVSALFGGIFMDDLFTNKRDVYLRELVQSGQALLQEITQLDVILNVHDKGGGETTASAGGGNGSDSGSSYADGWSSRTEKALLTILVVVSLAGVGLGFLYWGRRRRRKRRQEHHLQLDGHSHIDEYHDEWDEPAERRQQMQKASLARKSSDASASVGSHHSNADLSFVSSITGGTFLSRPPPLTTRETSLDSVRHGQDVYHRSSTSSAMSVLDASDRYLSRHRPDLYHDQSQHQADNNQVTVFGRSYEIPSNPFDYIYKGYFQQQPLPQSQQSNFSTPTNYPTSQHGGSGSGGGGIGSDGAGTSFPFLLSPRGAFTPSSSSVGGGSTLAGAASMAGGRRSSFNVPSPHHSSFTPIGTERDGHNLMAAASDEGPHPAFGSPPTPTQGAHTGQSWLDGGVVGTGPNGTDAAGGGAGAGGVVANIWRNLSMSSWYNSSPYGFAGSEEEEVRYHDDDDGGGGGGGGPSWIHPGTSGGDIELEDLHEDYDFPFQDFPRHDGTPCLIFNEDALLKERQGRVGSASAAADMLQDNFVIGSSENSLGDDEEDDDDGPAEKKTDDRGRRGHVSNEMFQRMLSQNSLAIDDASFDDGDEGDIGPVKPAPRARAPAFQKELSRLLETKQRRYAMEFKKNDIMEEHRKKRKQDREQERRDRHKAMEREIEEIEAEFLTEVPSKVILQYPVSPMRSGSSNSSRSGGGYLHSPKAPRYSGATTTSSASPRASTRSPARVSGGLYPTVGASAPSPFRSRGSGEGSGHVDVMSWPETSHAGYGEIAKSASSVEGAHRRGAPSPTGGLEDFDVSQPYKLKVRPVNMYGSDMFGNGTPQQEFDDLTLPSMGEGSAAANDADAKYPSPQSVLDELMQPSASSKSYLQPRIQQNYSPSMQHRRTRTPTKPPSSSPLPSQQHRRINSFDVEDLFHRSRRSSSASVGSHGNVRHHPTDGAQTTVGRQQPPSPGGHRRHFSNSVAMSPTGGRGHRRGHSLTPGHKRTGSQHSLSGAAGSDAGRGGHVRSSSQQSGDVFLHGVVAQTRFV